MKMVNGNILVKIIPESNVTPGGIVLPTSLSDSPLARCIVKSSEDDSYNEDDVVVVREWDTSTRIEIDGELLSIVSVQQVLCVL